ncbi:MAG: hypothetical protein M0O96_05195 [Desulforhopalus sp.]|nr:hypothetical protein [Desulforhopalus sp.]
MDTPEQQVEVERILRLLPRSLGCEKVNQMCSLLADHNLRDLVRILLLEYYDPRCTRSMSSCTFALELSAEDIPQCAARLTEFRASLF